MGIEKNVKNVEKKIQLYYCLLGLMPMMFQLQLYSLDMTLLFIIILHIMVNKLISKSFNRCVRILQ